MSTENFSIVEGDLTTAKEKYIAHQCNCITKYAKGIAKTIFDKFPYSNIYTEREKYGATIPGKIIICGDGKQKRFIINMMGQVSPGKPKFPETNEKRAEYFKECLDEITKIKNLTSIAFPYNIGCGLAKGNWPIYQKMIEEFAATVKVPVVLYKFKQE